MNPAPRSEGKSPGTTSSRRACRKQSPFAAVGPHPNHLSPLPLEIAVLACATATPVVAAREQRRRRKPPSAATCQNPRVAPYTWTVREGSLDGPVVMKNYIYDVPDKEPVEGQELYLSNGSGPWRVRLLEGVPEVPRSPYNILVLERVD